MARQKLRPLVGLEALLVALAGESFFGPFASLARFVYARAGVAGRPATEGKSA